MPNAKIIFLLMVMFASALCSTRDYVIMLKSANHNKALHITPGGKVSAADISKAQNITIGSIGDFLITGIFKITLYSKEAGRYLCFNKHWKLVGMKNPKENCHFIESLDRGYFEFRSAVNRSRRVGFNRRFRPVVLQREQDLADACFHFMKIEAENFDQNDFPEAERKSAAATTKTTRTHQKRRNNQRMNKTISNNGHNSTLSNDGSSINNNNHLSETNKHNYSSGSLQPKILVRHHHNNSSIVARRRQHQREQKIRQRRKQIQNQDTASSSTNLSAKSSSTLLAPSVLNIVATLAASRRTRGRRKSDDIGEEDEEDSDEAVKQKKVIRTSSITESTTVYLSPRNSEYRHRHHHLHQHHPHHQIANDHPKNFNKNDADFSVSGKKIKSTATSGLQQQFSNEYSNKNRKTNSNINNKNYLAIPALPKNLYNNNNNNNNRMTEYVYSGSTNINNNLNFNNNNDRTSSNSSSKTSNIDSHSKNININNNLNIDNNLKDYLNTTRGKDHANRKNLFEAIKNNNKTKNIVQYRYAVSFILIKNSS